MDQLFKNWPFFNSGFFEVIFAVGRKKPCIHFLCGFETQLINNCVRQDRLHALCVHEVGNDKATKNWIKVSTPIVIVLQIRSDV